MLVCSEGGGESNKAITVPFLLQRRNNSMPASHSSLYGMSMPSRGSATPHDFHSLVSSPISIHSPFGPKGAKKLPDIGEASLEAHSKLAPSQVSTHLDLHSKFPPNSQTTPTGSEKRPGARERRSSKREKRLQGSTPSGSQHGGHDSKLSRGTPRRMLSHDAAAAGSEEQQHSSMTSPHVARGSPQVLRRMLSRDEVLSSPNPDSREAVSVGERDTGGGSDVSTPSSTHTSGGEARGGAGKGSEGSIKHDKSPEIVMDDVSGSSLSTSSFDVSIQLLDATSPPQIILKAMENQE